MTYVTLNSFTMQCKFTKSHEYTHDENRYKICLLCLGKTKKMFKIENSLLTKLNSALNSEISLDRNLPCALCNSCKRQVYFANSKNKNRNVTINLPDFSKFSNNTRVTRSCDNEKKISNEKCLCHLCDLARTSFFKTDKRESVKYNTSKGTIATLRCIKCFCEIKKGLKHVCNNKARIENILKEVKDTPDTKKKMKLTSAIQDIQRRKTTKKESSQISVEDMSRIQNKHNLSDNAILGIATDLRVGTSSRKIVEPGLKISLYKKNHGLDQFFDLKKTTFIKTQQKVETCIEKTVVYCKDVKGLIAHVIEKRKIRDVHLKFGIDGGREYLKLCAVIQSVNTDEVDDTNDERQRQKLKDGVRKKDFKDSGVKKLFILAIAHGVQEKYENVLKIWNMLNINELSNDYTIATDFKLANVLTGLMAHSSTCPCTYCNVKKDSLENQGVLRTVGSCIQNYESWKENGSDKKKAKDFDCCVNPPIFYANKYTTILSIIPPPELHLLLGVVNTLVDKLSEECSDIANKWIKECNVKRETTNGGTGFNGNSCKALLNKIDILRSKDNLPSLKYVDTLSKFKNVVEACFGTKLKPGYNNKIELFKRSYLDLKISITPKVHVVFHHIEDFCSRQKDGLGFFSEQAMESVHFDFLTRWKNYKVSLNHLDYGQHLLKAVCSYNSHHL